MALKFRQLIISLLLALSCLAFNGDAAIAQDAQSADRAELVADEAEFRTEFRRLKRDNSIQFDLVTETPPPPDPPPRWIQVLGEIIGAIFSALQPIFVVVFWIGVIALGLLIFYAIINAILTARRQPGPEPKADPVEEYRPDTRMARVLLEEADALAAQGEYGAAVRMLLRRSIQDIETARPDAVRLSLTAREIAASPALGPRTRETFSHIAMISERSHFGGRNLNDGDYTQARETYTAFAGLDDVRRDAA